MLIMENNREEYISFETIRTLALEQDFCDVGAAKVKDVDISFLNTWLEKGFHASMSYMENNKDLRQNPNLLVPYAKTIICFLLSYNDERADTNSNLKIASYAQRKDYHYVIKGKLNNIISTLKSLNPNIEAIAFTDSAPVLERYWAEQCDLGWKGKNSLLVTKNYGSKVFIGEMLCNFSTDYATQQEQQHCGSCTRCIDACPNKAISSNGEIDCNRCISYQTIENKGTIPNNIDTKNYIYGCDLCLEACPWNNKAIKTVSQDLEVKELIADVLKKIQNNTFEKSDFNKLKKLSPINRIKFEKFLDNIQHAKTNPF